MNGGNDAENNNPNKPLITYYSVMEAACCCCGIWRRAGEGELFTKCPKGVRLDWLAIGRSLKPFPPQLAASNHRSIKKTSTARLLTEQVDELETERRRFTNRRNRLRAGNQE